MRTEYRLHRKREGAQAVVCFHFAAEIGTQSALCLVVAEYHFKKTSALMSFTSYMTARWMLSERQRMDALLR
jgi:hypothetical protein